MGELYELSIPEDYFVDVTIDSPDVTPAIAALLRRAGVDPNSAEMVKLATDRRYSREATILDEVEVVGRLKSWSIKEGRYVLLFPSGLVVYWKPSEEWARLDIGERVSRLSGVVYVKARRCVENRPVFCAEKIRFLRPLEDKEAVKKVLMGVSDAASSCGLTPLAAAFTAIHMRRADCMSMVTLGLRYALLAQRGVFHSMEWSVKATLKSTVFSIIDAYDSGWLFTGEAPSLATLIGDARTGESRLAAVDIVMFDEIGSWKLPRSQAGELWAALRSGLANCKWRRARGGATSIEIEKCIATYWAGNPIHSSFANIPPIEQSRMWLDNQGLEGEEAAAMLSRFSVFWGVYDTAVADTMMRNLRYAMPAPGLMLGLLGLARRYSADKAREAPPPPGSLSERRVHYWRRVYGVAASVFQDPAVAAEAAEALVRGLFVVKADKWERMG